MNNIENNENNNLCPFTSKLASLRAYLDLHKNTLQKDIDSLLYTPFLEYSGNMLTKTASRNRGRI